MFKVKGLPVRLLFFGAQILFFFLDIDYLPWGKTHELSLALHLYLYFD